MEKENCINNRFRYKCTVLEATSVVIISNCQVTYELKDSIACIDDMAPCKRCGLSPVIIRTVDDVTR